MKKKTLLTLCLLTAAMLGIQAQGPNGSGTYYKRADGKSGAELKTTMFNIIKSLSTASYTGLKDAYTKTDVRADGYLRDWYSNATKYTPGSSFSSSGTEGQGYNREHTIPQSWFGEATPMKCDIMHVVPTDCAVNGMRSDFPFGEVDPNKKKYKESKNGYSKFGYSKTPGYADLVFEPNDEIKGDLARIYFYMATCYEDQIATWTKANGGTVIQGNSYQPYVQWTFDMLLRWAKLDPVDEVEKARNIAAYGVQKNRNPFVDYPGLEDYIWGSKKDVPFSYNNYDPGDIVIAQRAEQPVFQPNGGIFTDSVRVTIGCATPGAVIFYTTDGTDATVNSLVYSDSITLKTTTTLKAIAVCDSMTNSYQQEATYVIRSSQPGGNGDEVTIALNSSTLGSLVSGKSDYSVTQDGITVTYSKGGSANQYISDSQIRLYPDNTLTISSDVGDITDAEFTKVGGKGDKVLQASTGTVSGMTWAGQSPRVVFSVNDGSGHIQLSKVKVKTLSSMPPQPVQGDVNGDNVVDVADIATIISVMAGNILPGVDPALFYDVNDDGVVDVADIAAIISIMSRQ